MVRVGKRYLSAQYAARVIIDRLESVYFSFVPLPDNNHLLWLIGKRYQKRFFRRRKGD
jgi:hypothetical protein